MTNITNNEKEIIIDHVHAEKDSNVIRLFSETNEILIEIDWITKLSENKISFNDEFGIRTYKLANINIAKFINNRSKEFWFDDEYEKNGITMIIPNTGIEYAKIDFSCNKIKKIPKIKYKKPDLLDGDSMFITMKKLFEKAKELESTLCVQYEDGDFDCIKEIKETSSSYFIYLERGPIMTFNKMDKKHMKNFFNYYSTIKFFNPSEGCLVG